MRLKIKPIVIMFFIIYIFVYALTSCSALKAEEPKLNCETFVKEEICNMTDEEQEIWFLELLLKILEDTIEKKKIGTEV
tara:strand:- start:31 stop:267 length:237 start_codon:yes stop_codon:yes gene_type:complete